MPERAGCQLSFPHHRADLDAGGETRSDRGVCQQHHREDATLGGPLAEIVRNRRTRGQRRRHTATDHAQQYQQAGVQRDVAQTTMSNAHSQFIDGPFHRRHRQRPAFPRICRSRSKLITAIRSCAGAPLRNLLFPVLAIPPLMIICSRSAAELA